MAGSVYTYVGNADLENQTAAILTSQGVVALGHSGLFLPGELTAAEGQGLLLTAGPSASPFPFLNGVTVVAGAAGTPNGAYRYVVTFITAAGETTPGPEAGPVTLSNQRGSISNIPVGSATSGVIARRIYRTAASGSAGTEKLVATIADNVTTLFTDNVADGALGTIPPLADSSAVIGGSVVVSSAFITTTVADVRYLLSDKSNLPPSIPNASTGGAGQVPVADGAGGYAWSTGSGGGSGSTDGGTVT